MLKRIICLPGDLAAQADIFFKFCVVAIELCKISIECPYVVIKAGVSRSEICIIIVKIC